MASFRASTTQLIAIVALFSGHALAAAYTNTASSNEAQSSGQAAPRAAQDQPIQPSDAEIGIASMMQMLRDEGIDIDARMARVRAQCRSQVVAEAVDASSEDIETAVEECAVVEESIVYAQAINEMNANRVNSFNDAMDRHNAEVAAADQAKLDYEREMAAHNAELAEIERQREQYERDMAAHEQLVSGQSGGSNSSETRTRSARSDNSSRSLLGRISNLITGGSEDEEETPSDAQTEQPAAARAQVEQPEPAQVAAANEPAPQPQEPARSTTTTLAQVPPPSAAPLTRSAQPSASTPPAAQRSGGPITPGRMLSRTDGTFDEEESVELAVMESNGPRIALVIGNESYDGGLGALSNPVNDAVLIGATLRSAGFDVEVLTDASQREMKLAVQRLGDRLLAAGDNATGLFYYAGHGVQADGTNYLIPIGSAIDAESDLEIEAVSADAILAQLEEAYISTRIVILDACRNMPLRRRTRSGTRGLARMETPNGSFVAYSTSPGNTADDGGGIHSPFAEALASQMLVPDRPIEVTFREVRRQVVEKTNGDQVPWDSSSLLETFSFARTR